MRSLPLCEMAISALSFNLGSCIAATQIGLVSKGRGKSASLGICSRRCLITPSLIVCLGVIELLFFANFGCCLLGERTIPRLNIAPPPPSIHSYAKAHAALPCVCARGVRNNPITVFTPLPFFLDFLLPAATTTKASNLFCTLCLEHSSGERRKGEGVVQRAPYSVFRAYYYIFCTAREDKDCGGEKQ